MSTSAKVITEDDLLRLPADGNRYELVGGELRQMSPTGYEHGRCTGNLHALLWTHVRRLKLGHVLAAETGFVLDRTSDGKLTVRAADVAFVAMDRIPKDADRTRYLRIAPDVVVETLSPSDSAADVEEKISYWIRAAFESRSRWIRPRARLPSTARHRRRFASSSGTSSISATWSPDFAAGSQKSLTDP